MLPAGSSENFRDCWFLTGPTASGKSAVALELAQRLGAEILSLDSMAVYRGMDIGTAKPSQAEQARVPHHLIDLADPWQEFSVADYLAAAARVVADLHARGRVALFVGGTPFYLKALLRGISTGPQADWPLRHKLLARAEREGPVALHAELAAVDPASAARLHPHDLRRVVRALEVYLRSGEPLTTSRPDWDRTASAAGKVFALSWPRETLHARINARVEAMFAAGWEQEVQALLAAAAAAGVAEPWSRTASQAVGYAEVIQLLARRQTRGETLERVAARTRQFAKRQMTWFRSLAECRPVEMGEPVDPAAVADRILALAAAPPGQPIAPKGLERRSPE